MKLNLVNNSVTEGVGRGGPGISVVTATKRRRAVRSTFKLNLVSGGRLLRLGSFGSYSMVFLYTPMGGGVRCLARLGSVVGSSYVVASMNDAGARVRRGIVRLNLRHGFVNNRPVANSRGANVLGSSGRLLRGTCCVVAPATTAARRGRGSFERFMLSLNSVTLVLSCERRSRTATTVDRLPRVVTCSLIGLVRRVSSRGRAVGAVTTNNFHSIAHVTTDSPIV